MYVSVVCEAAGGEAAGGEAAGGGTDGGGRDAESKTRTPHKDVGSKNNWDEWITS